MADGSSGNVPAVLLRAEAASATFRALLPQLALFPLRSILRDGGDVACTCSKSRNCKQIGKHPACFWKHLEARGKWRGESWGTDPEAGWGIATGVRSGLFVVDLDGSTAIEAFHKMGGVPRTFAVKRGEDRRHLYFKHPGFRVKNSAGELGVGIDIRGDGGYAVCPGSPHKSGALYEIADDVPIVDAPNWLLNRPELRGSVSTHHAGGPAAAAEDAIHVKELPIGDPNSEYARWRMREADDYLRTAPLACFATPGQGRRDIMYRIACKLVRHLRLPTDLAADAIERTYNPRLVAAGMTPWSRTEPGDHGLCIIERLENARTTGSGEPSCPMTEDEWLQWGAITKRGANEPADAQTSKAAESVAGDDDDGEVSFGDVNKPKRMSVAERARRVGGEGVRLPTAFATIDTATRGGILLRKVVCIGGAPGAGKTATCVQIAFRWLERGVVVGFMCADEDADAILIRFGQLAGLSRERLEAGDHEERERLAAWAESVPFYLYDGDEDGTTIETVSTELRELASEQPSALFVDSIQTARTTAQPPRGADMRARTNVVVQALKTAAKVGGHVVVATSELSKAAYRNTAQGEINLLSAFKESGDIEYGVALALVLTSRPGASDVVDGVVVKNRLGQGKPALTLHLDHARACVVETSADEADFRTELADRSSELRGKILDALRRGPARTQDEIGTRVKRTAAHVRAAVKALIVERQIVNLPGQGYTLDTPEGRRKRIEDAVAASILAGYSTLTKLAKAAFVDAAELQELVATGELMTSGKGFVLASR